MTQGQTNRKVFAQVAISRPVFADLSAATGNPFDVTGTMPDAVVLASVPSDAEMDCGALVSPGLPDRSAWAAQGRYRLRVEQD